MSQYRKLLTKEALQIKAIPNATLKLRLLLHNQTTETMLVRPALEDWVCEENSIISTINHTEPAYICLLAGETANQTIIVEIPSLPPGKMLKSWLHFPGVQEAAILIQVEIVATAHRQNSQVILPLLEIPLSGDTDLLSRDAATSGIFGLISGLLALDQIPSRYLVAELSVILAQQGEVYAQTLQGSELLGKLQQTSFFGNGVRAFNKASVTNWISQSLFTINPVLGSGERKGHLLYIWEQWLLSLVETDLEAGELNQVFTPPLFDARRLATASLSETLTAKLPRDEERWFTNIILGLAVSSPSIAATLKVIACKDANTSSESQTIDASNTLSALLLGLDTLGVRWLVLELLLILRQKGDKFAQTSQGSQLIAQLRRTRFFKNGVLALAAAQAPRWLAVSQSTALAFHAQLGGDPGKQGLLYVWEQWLWSLSPPNLLTPILPATAEALVSEVPMDAEQWFANLVLGLAVVSPRIAAILKTIAAIAPIPVVISQPQVFLEDVISEGSSMQR